MTFNDRQFDVEIELNLRSDTGEIHASFQSLDPGSGLPPDVLTGFLPPEDGTGRGQGYFSYVIDLHEGLASGPGAITIDGQGLAYISGFFFGTMVFDTETGAFVRGQQTLRRPLPATGPRTSRQNLC